jgi:hypothetical protein
MKSLYLLFSFLFLFSLVASAQLLEENFDYSTGDLSTNWTAISGSAGNAPQIISPGLSYAGYGSTGVGNAVNLASVEGKDYYRTFGNVNTGTVYLALLLNVTSAAPTGDYFLFMSKDAPVGANYMGRLYAKSSGSGFQLGIAKSNEAASYASVVLAYNTTHLVVIKYTFVAGTTNDLVDLFINPTTPSAVEGTPAASGSVSASDGNTPRLETVVLRQDYTSSNLFTPAVTIDGIRISTSYETSLPVELTYFHAKTLASNQVQIKWATASEHNSDYFLLERSQNLQQFIRIAQVGAAGQSRESRTYSYLDETALAGAYYYRLTQVDRDGTRQAYRPVSVQVGEGGSRLAVYPNPSTGEVFYVRGTIEAIASSIDLFDLSGKQIPINRNNDDGLMLFPQQSLRKGLYIIQIRLIDGTVSRHKLLVK